MWIAEERRALLCAALLSLTLVRGAAAGDVGELALHHQRIALAKAERLDASGWTPRGPTAACPLLLHLWAPWCGPCVAELPQLGPFLRSAKEQTPGAGLAYAALDSRAAVQRFIAAHPLDLPQEHGRYRMDPALRFSLGAALPTTLLLDQHGQVRQAYVGGLQSQRAREELLTDLARLAGACAGTPQEVTTPLTASAAGPALEREERGLLHRRLTVPELSAPWGGAAALPGAALRLVILHQEPQRCPRCVDDFAAIERLRRGQSERFKVVLLRGSSAPPPGASLYQLAYSLPAGTPTGQAALLLDEAGVIRHAILGPLRQRLSELQGAIQRLLRPGGR